MDRFGVTRRDVPNVSVGCGTMPPPAAVAQRLRPLSAVVGRNAVAPNRYRLGRRWDTESEESDELDGPRQSPLTGAVGGSAPGG